MPSTLVQNLCLSALLVIGLVCASSGCQPASDSGLDAGATSEAVSNTPSGSSTTDGKGYQGSGHRPQNPSTDRTVKTDQTVSLPQQHGVLRVLSGQVSKANTHSDQWAVETLNKAAKHQLYELGHLLTEGTDLTTEALAPLASATFSCDFLRPPDLKQVYTDGRISVHRPAAASEADGEGKLGIHVGVEGMRQALSELWQQLADGTDQHVAFKIFRVQQQDDAQRFTTRSYYEASGQTNAGGLQQNCVWVCNWVWPESKQSADHISDPPAEQPYPLLESIQVEQYEEVALQAAAGRLFADCTQAALGESPCYPQQIARSQAYWARRIQIEIGIGMIGYHGVAIGDVNGDGLEDLYCSLAGGMPNLLLIHQPDGTLVEKGAESGVDFLDQTSSVLFVDVENDGDQDLVLSFRTRISVMTNDGQGNFSPHTTMPTVSTHSLAAADYDNDGLIDIFVCRYGTGINPVPYHDANNGQPNSLFRNLGDGRFVDVTTEAGLDQNNRRFSFAAAWEDYDNDGDQDLYIANDHGRNNLYRNDQGRFTDVAAAVGVEDVSAGMSASWGDYNRDGYMDLYVSNMFSSAGNRITYQRQFKTSAPEESRQHFQRHARGNSLFAGGPAGTFTDESLEAGVTMGRWAWDSKFADINNDGRDDLLVANGEVTNEDTGDL